MTFMIGFCLGFLAHAVLDYFWRRAETQQERDPYDPF
jgi:hypothetical protein